MSRGVSAALGSRDAGYGPGLAIVSETNGSVGSIGTNPNQGDLFNQGSGRFVMRGVDPGAARDFLRAVPESSYSSEEEQERAGRLVCMALDILNKEEGSDDDRYIKFLAVARIANSCKDRDLGLLALSLAEDFAGSLDGSRCGVIEQTRTDGRLFKGYVSLSEGRLRTAWYMALATGFFESTGMERASQSVVDRAMAAFVAARRQGGYTSLEGFIGGIVGAIDGVEMSAVEKDLIKRAKDSWMIKITHSQLTFEL